MAYSDPQKRALRQTQAQSVVPTKPGRPKKRYHPEIVDQVTPNPYQITPLQLLVAQWFARGVGPSQIARRMQHQLVPHEADDKLRMKKAKKRVRTWLSTAKMRDAVYAEAQILLDLESPAIMRGVAKKAKAGRVDAARLAFELNGRHSPHTDVQPASINIVFAGVPRPSVNRPQLDDPDLVDADVDEEIDDGTGS